ncbi:MAG: hypothetical protein SGJ27_10405 [Candidatus Melainabacteria bacterium]|mgnify:CR=1 FL=1|nr:hypothetical protein [Candidatus Melainabacteria bacterium]
MHRSIQNLQTGESAFTPAHAAWLESSHMYLNGSYPIRPHGGGSFSLRLIKYPNGALAVDLTGCSSGRFSTFSAFGDDVIRVPVDVALTRPLPTPNRRRICDMACHSFGYVNVASAWIYGGNLWLDGLAPTSLSCSSETPLLVERWCDGSFVIDNHYCQGALYPTDWIDSPWPVQVLKLIKSPRLHY